MYRRSDPRFRRTLNEISQTFESANESAQANVYSFSHHYIEPCVSSISGCFSACTSPCFPARDQRRRSRARSRGRAELSFDFYDDWDEDEEDAGLLGWSNDEYDSLLGTTAQPGRQRAMSYGARRGNKPRDGDDPTVVPASSKWGFLGKLTGKIGGGGKNLRYKPSAADLQEHPGASRALPEGAPLLEEEDEGDEQGARGHKRNRSNTQGSGNTTDSLSSRGDIFPSEDELDDAIPLDDEFAMVLERRTTNSGNDEVSSGRKGKRPSAGSRLSTRTMSSRSSRDSRRQSRRASNDSHANDFASEAEPKIIPSMAELKKEEERAQKEEEETIAQRREAAQRLAAENGLASPTLVTEKRSQPTSPDKQDTLQETPVSESTTPFPDFDPPPVEENATQRNEATSEHPENTHTADVNFNPAQLPRLS